MKNLLVVTALYALLPVAGYSQETAAPEQGSPPASLTERDGFWTAKNAPPDSENFEIHVVRTGKTLRALAGLYFDNPFLWPQLWEANEHIIKPHWTYPEDRILIRQITQITEAEPPEPASDAEPQPEPFDDEAPESRPSVQLPNLTRDLGPIADTVTVFDLPEATSAPEVKATDLYRAVFITTDIVSGDFSVLAKAPGTSTESLYVVSGDYAHLNQGSNAGIQPGSLYSAVRPTLEIDSPREQVGELGRHYPEVGQLETVTVAPEFSMARAVHTCDAIGTGDTLVAFNPIDFPELPSDRPFSPTNPSSRNTMGAIVGAQSVLLLIHPSLGASAGLAGIESSRLASFTAGVSAEGAIVYIDLGERDGIQSGNLFLIYRPLDLDNRFSSVSREADRLLSGQRQVIGELVEIKVEEQAAAALVTFASDGVSWGDLIELR